MKARSVKKLDPTARLDENAARIVRVRLAEMLGFTKKARRPKATKAQHDMRIAAKRLRYVLEVTDFCFGRPAQIGRRRARDLQDILGEIHDCDVMLPRVLEQLEKTRDADAAEVVALAGDAPDLEPGIAAQAPHRTAYRGLDVLAVYLRSRRELLFSRFIATLDRLEGDGTWLRLERAADSVLERAALRREEERAAEAERQRLEAQRLEAERPPADPPPADPRPGATI